MKTLSMVVGALSLIAGLSVQACPDLGGTYSCKYKGFNVGVRVNQTRQGNAAVYDVDYSLGQVTVVTDGQPHNIDRLPPLDNHVSDLVYTATCRGQTVVVTGTGKMRNGSGDAKLDGTLDRNGRQVSIRFAVTGGRNMNVALTCVQN